MDQSAFEGCVSLASVDFPNATFVRRAAFRECDSLSSVNLPKAVELGEFAFYGCEELTHLDLPNVQDIGNDAFLTTKLSTLDVRGLRRTQVYDQLKDWGVPDRCLVNCKDGSLTVDLATFANDNLTYDSVKYVVAVDNDNLESDLEDRYALGIGDTSTTETDPVGMFHGERLVSVTMPYVENIGKYAFAGCTKLQTASFGSALNVGESAFFGCSELGSVQLPNVTTLGAKAFYGCAQLQSVDLPKVSQIGENAFQGCLDL